jgi:hypothetical protein
LALVILFSLSPVFSPAIATLVSFGTLCEKTQTRVSPDSSSTNFAEQASACKHSIREMVTSATSISPSRFLGRLLSSESLTPGILYVGANCSHLFMLRCAASSAMSSCDFEERFADFLSLTIGLNFSMLGRGTGALRYSIVRGDKQKDNKRVTHRVY